MAMADIQNGPLHYQIKGAGPALILLLPISRGPEGLTPMIDLLAENFQVIQYDQRGYGDSPASGQELPISLADRATEVLALIDYLGLEKVHLLGHSTGCGIALEVIAAAAARVLSVSLVSPWSYGDAQLVQMQGLRVAVAAALGAADYAAYNASLLFPPWYRQQHAAGFAELAAAALDHPQDAKEIENGLIPILQFDGRSIAAAVDCPALIINAEDDQLMPPWHGQCLARIMKGALFVTLPTGGHMLLETSSKIVEKHFKSLILK